MFGSPNSLTKTFFEIKNTIYTKMNAYFYGAFTLICSPIDDLIYTNSTFSDFYCDQNFVWMTRNCNSVIIKNFMFENAIGNRYQGIQIFQSQYIQMNNITLRNVTGAEFPVTPFITTNISPSTSLIIDTVTVEDCPFLMNKLYVTLASIGYFELVNVHFSNVSIAGGESIMVLDDIKHLVLTNLTFENVINSDTTNEGSAIILLNSLNLNSNVSTQVYEVSIHFH